MAPSLSIPHRMGVMSPGDRAQLFCGPCVLKDPVAALCYRTTVSAKPASGTCTVSSFTHFMASVSAHLSPESRNWRTNTLQGLAPYVTFQWAEWLSRMNNTSPPSLGTGEQTPFKGWPPMWLSSGQNEQPLGDRVINSPISFKFLLNLLHYCFCFMFWLFGPMHVGS